MRYQVSVDQKLSFVRAPSRNISIIVVISPNTENRFIIRRDHTRKKKTKVCNLIRIRPGYSSHWIKKIQRIISRVMPFRKVNGIGWPLKLRNRKLKPPRIFINDYQFL